MTVLYALEVCLKALAIGVIVGITFMLLAVIVYVVAGVISSSIQTFKEVRAKNRFNKAMLTLNKFAESLQSIKQQKENNND